MLLNPHIKLLKMKDGEPVLKQAFIGLDVGSGDATAGRVRDNYVPASQLIQTAFLSNAKGTFATQNYPAITRVPLLNALMP